MIELHPTLRSKANGALLTRPYTPLLCNANAQGKLQLYRHNSDQSRRTENKGEIETVT